MLKVKKKIQNPKNQNGLTDLQNEIKNFVKNLYFKDQKNKKTINEYTDILAKIRNEYAQLQKENNQLRIEIQKYQRYIQYNENVSQTPYRKPAFKKRKRIQYYESDEGKSYIPEIRRRPKQPKKKENNI